MSTVPRSEKATAFLCVAEFPKRLKHAFRAWCEIRSTFMKDKLVSMVREIVKLPAKRVEKVDKLTKEGEKKKETCNLMIRGFPMDLRNSFKAWCLLSEITMRDKLIDMIRLELKKVEK